MDVKPQTDAEKLYCSFCGKPQNDTALLIEGAGSAFICEDCIAGCVNILADRHRVKCGLLVLTEAVI